MAWISFRCLLAVFSNSDETAIPPHAGLAHTGLYVGYDSLSLTVETTVKNSRFHDARKTVDYTTRKTADYMTRKIVDYMNRRRFRRHLHAQLAGPAAEVVGGAGLLGSRPALAALDDSDRRELPQPRCQLPPAVRGSGSARSVRCTLIHAHQLPQCAKLRVRNACRRSYAGTAPRRTISAAPHRPKGDPGRPSLPGQSSPVQTEEASRGYFTARLSRAAALEAAGV